MTIVVSVHNKARLTLPRIPQVITSTTVLGLLTDRAAVISWVSTPTERGFIHGTLIDLFRSPGFDWWYTPDKYRHTRFRRWHVRGFGQEVRDSFPIEPPQLLCDDLIGDSTPWFEMHWRYDAFAAAIVHNPSLHGRATQLFAADDFFGPVARKLFYPVPSIWERIMSVRNRVLTPPPALSRWRSPAFFVVGIELGRPEHAQGALRCIAARGLKRQYVDIKTAADAMPEHRLVRYFVSLPLLDAAARERFTQALGTRRVVTYKSSALFNPRGKYILKYPSEQRELVEEFAMQLSDVVLVPRSTDRTRHFLFSQRAIVFNDTTCEADVQCQPCFNWKNVSQFACVNRSLADSLIGDAVQSCSHSLWHRW